MIQRIGFWGPFGRGPQRGGTPKLCQTICFQISTDMKIHWHHKLGRSRNWFLGGLFWGGPRGGGWHPQTMSKYLSVKYVLISKKTGTLV